MLLFEVKILFETDRNPIAAKQLSIDRINFNETDYSPHSIWFPRTSNRYITKYVYSAYV